MNTLRVVVTGAPGAGKSSFVQAISENNAVDTDRTATDETSQIKQTTTVAMDYGHLSIGHKLHLHLYGTPGQSRFDFMWDFLIRRADAYILLVAAHRPHDFARAKEIMAFMNERSNIPMIVGVTHLDCPRAYSLDQIMLKLGFGINHQPMAIAVNANDKTSIHAALYLCVVAQLLNQHQPNSHQATSVRPTTAEQPLYGTHSTKAVSSIATYSKQSLLPNRNDRLTQPFISIPLNRTR
jgi:uncharacterized protein